MKHAILLSLLIGSAMTATAQTKAVERLTLEARGDYQRDYVDGHYREEKSGFDGKYLNLLMDGHISDKISYSYRQRFNKASLDAGFFNATDWFFVNYKPTDEWTLSAGKQVIDIGGWEYDYAPINLYFCSEFWNMTPCYAWGASAAYKVTKDDQLRFQICESPNRQFTATNDVDLYTYNLMWYGQHGPWGAKWSLNMVEWDKGHYINYIALGNEVRFSREVSLEIDYMNRATSSHTFFFRDCSVMGQLNYQPSNYLKFFAKATYDVNNTECAADLTVTPGTEMTRLGAGLEYYPLGNNKVRVHANYCYSMGTNTNPGAVMLPKQSLIDLGLTWRIHLM